MPESPSDAVLDRLLALQAADHHVRKVEHRLDALPEQQQLDEAVARVADLERQLEELSSKLERANTEQRTLERDIETLGNRRDAERVRLYDGTVTNQREMSSVEAEIESTERRLEEHEEDLLVVMQTVEDLERRWSTVDTDLVAARARARGAEEARDEVAKALLAELGEAKADRDREAAELPDDLLGRYEAAAARGGGTGVGQLDGLACSACRIEMSRADVDELYKGGTLTTCPQCRRLLVVR
ncbi:zinc ribbon domain-containing protein [Nitriliruptor alkaliphilus]|uniref:zinc ribbon domain-containing protein n=1 Tax=Nitriliruptor alkaliphilus TaxID=427918 RepID=UPI0012ED91C9|nr:C4-type zinc ribbon domain-containing protein [Nitriliruptor alkaliphilus]